MLITGSFEGWMVQSPQTLALVYLGSLEAPTTTGYRPKIWSELLGSRLQTESCSVGQTMNPKHPYLRRRHSGIFAVCIQGTVD